jgi:hypothetical protein
MSTEIEGSAEEISAAAAKVAPPPSRGPKKLGRPPGTKTKQPILRVKTRGNPAMKPDDDTQTPMTRSPMTFVGVDGEIVDLSQTSRRENIGDVSDFDLPQSLLDRWPGAVFQWIPLSVLGLAEDAAEFQKARDAGWRAFPAHLAPELVSPTAAANPNAPTDRGSQRLYIRAKSLQQKAEAEFRYKNDVLKNERLSEVSDGSLGPAGQASRQNDGIRINREVPTGF